MGHKKGAIVIAPPGFGKSRSASTIIRNGSRHTIINQKEKVAVYRAEEWKAIGSVSIRLTFFEKRNYNNGNREAG